MSKGLLIIGLLMSLSCSPSARHKVLKVFFDGVPDRTERGEADAPSQVVPATPQVTEEEPVVPTLSRHPDYAQKRCSRCHDKDAGNALVAGRKEICYTCHKPEDYQGAYVHGPVAVGDCLSCHRPHESTQRKLLEKEDRDLCLKCHKPDDVSRVDVHRKNAHMGCSECHLPHASDVRYFLKEP